MDAGWPLITAPKMTLFQSNHGLRRGMTWLCTPQLEGDIHVPACWAHLPLCDTVICEEEALAFAARKNQFSSAINSHLQAPIVALELGTSDFSF